MVYYRLFNLDPMIRCLKSFGPRVIGNNNGVSLIGRRSYSSKSAKNILAFFKELRGADTFDEMEKIAIEEAQADPELYRISQEDMGDNFAFVENEQELDEGMADHTVLSMLNLDWEGHFNKYHPDLENFPENMKGMEIEWEFYFYPPTAYPESFNLRRGNAAAYVNLKEFKFSDKEVELFRLVCGPRYNHKTKQLRLTYNKHETARENIDHLKQMISTLIDEVKTHTPRLIK